MKRFYCHTNQPPEHHTERQTHVQPSEWWAVLSITRVMARERRSGVWIGGPVGWGANPNSKRSTRRDGRAKAPRRRCHTSRCPHGSVTHTKPNTPTPASSPRPGVTTTETQRRLSYLLLFTSSINRDGFHRANIFKLPLRVKNEFSVPSVVVGRCVCRVRHHQDRFHIDSRMCKRRADLEAGVNCDITNCLEADPGATFRT